MKVLVVVSAPVDCPTLLESALLPDHAPEAGLLEAEQEVALLDHVSVEAPPLATEEGFAVSDTVGAGGVTVTIAVALAVPPGPVQERSNVLELVNAPVGWLPESTLDPVPQAPEEVQDVALVEDQVSVEDPPLATDVGFAASDTVGTVGGGGVPATVTVAVELALPPGPVQVRE